MYTVKFNKNRLLRLCNLEVNKTVPKQTRETKPPDLWLKGKNSSETNCYSNGAEVSGCAKKWEHTLTLDLHQTQQRTAQKQHKTPTVFKIRDTPWYEKQQ